MIASLLTLLAQIETQSPLIGLPPPSEEHAGYWPIAMAIGSILIAGASAAFTAWTKIREKKVDTEHKQAAERTRVEIEALKIDAQQRKETFDSLSKEFQAALTEGRLLRTELRQTRAELNARDTVIAELRGTIDSLKARVRHLEDLEQ
jgi:septal ring factor EnvC (AmiA/AmiB activator)